MSPVPDVGQVARQTSRNDEQSIDADGIAGSGKSRRKPFRCNCHAAQAIFVERPGRRFSRRPLLDLDERHRPAAASDEVDLAARHSGPSGDDAPAFEAKPPGRKSLSLPSPRFGLLSFQLDLGQRSNVVISPLAWRFWNVS